SALGSESEGPPGWKVRLVVEGTLLTKDASISVIRPLDFRRQHIMEERFHSDKELRDPVKWKRLGQRKNTWRRQMGGAGHALFRLEYSFTCSWQRPTPGMERVTTKWDAAPAGEAYLRATPRIQAKEERLV